MKTVLLKFRRSSLLATRHFVFPFSAYLVQASEEIAQSNLEPTDAMIPWLVQLQKYTEDLHSLMTDSSFDSNDRLVILLNSFTQIQATISHSIAERRTSCVSLLNRQSANYGFSSTARASKSNRAHAQPGLR